MCPQQVNSSDCGLYVFGNIRLLTMAWLKNSFSCNYDIIALLNEKWTTLTPEAVNCIRRELSEIIDKLIESGDVFKDK